MPRAPLLCSSRWDPPDTRFAEIEGASPEVRHLKREMALVARDPDVTVLLTGESGTGKERVAKAIHDASPRGGEPFVVIDCAGLSPTLAEDALFGHQRGAFTGAMDDRAGPFERAARGTILLDEVGELSLDLQMKLLRAIQSRTVLRLGSVRETGFDARIMAATNVDLEAAVARGRFREDLYYRLDVYRIRLPALRQRGAADVAALIDATLRRLSARRGTPAPSVDAAAMARLARHRWPGNVRELENVVERMLVASAGRSCVTADDLPSSIADTRDRDRRILAGPPSAREVEAALASHDFKPTAAAAALGLSRHQLYRLVRRYGVGQPKAVP